MRCSRNVFRTEQGTMDDMSWGEALNHCQAIDGQLTTLSQWLDIQNNNPNALIENRAEWLCNASESECATARANDSYDMYVHFPPETNSARFIEEDSSLPNIIMTTSNLPVFRCAFPALTP